MVAFIVPGWIMLSVNHAVDLERGPWILFPKFIGTCSAFICAVNFYRNCLRIFGQREPSVVIGVILLINSVLSSVDYNYPTSILDGDLCWC